MANTPISGLTASATNLAAADVLPVVQTTGVGPVKMTGQQLAGGLLGSTTLTGATITANAPVLNVSQTWNNSGVTFTGLQFNAAGSSDANSAAGSLLMNLQVGGVSQFKVEKIGRFTSEYGVINSSLRMAIDGAIIYFGVSNDLLLTRRGAANLRLGAADAAAPVAQTLSVQSVVAGTSNTAGANLTITGSQGTGTGAGGSIIFQVAPAGSSGTAQNALATALTIQSTRTVEFSNGFNDSVGFFGGRAGSGLWVVSTGRLAFGGDFGGPFLRYDGATNALALRDGTTAQEFRVYNTFTDASNYERGAFYWSGNTLTIEAQNAGSGGNRGISVIGKGQVTIESTLSPIYFKTNSANRWFVDTTGAFNAAVDNTLDIGASGANRPRNLFLGSYAQMTEMTAPAAPAANSVRIYAEDNGSGKTRLMALFATGAAQQIAIEP